MRGTVAVTGASGHIGNVICRLLLKSGYRVRALYHTFSESLEGLDVDLVRGDMLNPSVLKNLMSGCDVVIHCAALITIHEDRDGTVFETNTRGPETAIQAALNCGVRTFIHFSSVHAVNEMPFNIPFNENRTYKTKESHIYDYSKSTGEQNILKHKDDNRIRIVILRPASVIGPYDFKPSEMGKAFIDFYHRKIPALPSGGFNFVDVRDVAASAIASIENGKHGEAYLLSGHYHTIKQMAGLVHRVTGKKVPRRVIPYELLKFSLPFISAYSRLIGAAPLFTQASIDALRYCHPDMDSSKAASALGHHPRPVEESIRDFYNWYHSDKKSEFL